MHSSGCISHRVVNIDVTTGFAADHGGEDDMKITRDSQWMESEEEMIVVMVRDGSSNVDIAWSHCDGCDAAHCAPSSTRHDHIAIIQVRCLWFVVNARFDLD